VDIGMWLDEASAEAWSTSLGRLPLPGGGATPERFERLAEIARRSLSQVKVLESHVDALAILAEAGIAAPAGLGAVWASDGPPGSLHLDEEGGQLTMSGRKPFCSGATLVDWALITCRLANGDVSLALVDIRDPRVEPEPSGWVGHGMRQADTRPVTFRAARVTCLVGGPNWYLTRPGFWHGAVGVAACWFGGALGVADALLTSVAGDPHALADAGGVASELYAMRAVLFVAGQEIDEHPDDAQQAYLRAARVRAVVERSCRAVLDASAHALGPRPLAFDEGHSQRVSDLQVYLLQHHGRRDLEELGRMIREGGTPRC
jgi:alkylation response protein AidB-like acyl-CoA dehydrogenase